MTAGALEIGSSRTVVLVDGLTRTRIVQYAGASGDFNPLHTDETYAKEVAKSPGVFAHGMLTMGMAAMLNSDCPHPCWLGLSAVDHTRALRSPMVSPKRSTAEIASSFFTLPSECRLCEDQREDHAFRFFTGIVATN